MIELLSVITILIIGVSAFAIAEDKRLKRQEKIYRYNPLAIDGDGDGKVQDGTKWERPAPKKAVAKKAPAKKKAAKKAPAKKKAAKKKK